MKKFIEKLNNAKSLLREGKIPLAVESACKILSENTNSKLLQIECSGIFIDAGSDLKDIKLIKKGIELLNKLNNDKNIKYNDILHYYLGTAYLVLGQWEKGYSPGTKKSLSLAVSHFDESMSFKYKPEAHINFAIALIDQGRCIEALDELDTIIINYPKHHVAYSSRSKAFRHIEGWLWPHKGLLESALEDISYAIKISENDPYYQSKYKPIQVELLKRIYYPNFNKKESSVFQDFIWDNRIALNPCHLCRLETPDAYDVFTLSNILEGGNRRPSSQVIRNLMNALHRSYGTARYCLLYGLGQVDEVTEDQIVLIEGTTESIHDLRTGMLISSISSFYNIFSQISFALNSYLNLGHNPFHVNFDNVWCEPNKSNRIPPNRHTIHTKLQRTTTSALSALYRLSLSLQHGLGRYADLRSFRNNIEHHIVVSSSGKNSPYYISITPDNLKEKALLSARLAKAALWYFGGVIWKCEYERLKRSYKKGNKIIHSHHKIYRIK